MKIIAARNKMDFDVQFLDKFGYIKHNTTYVNFVRGQIKNPYDRTICNVGYIGVGKYDTGTNIKHSVEYQNWVCMIRRCYDTELKERYSAYYGNCTVCVEWHNFQVFSEWYNNNLYTVGTERMHIDKDILFKDNKLYSPETCLLVPQRINMLFMKKPNKYGFPNGIKPASKGKFESKYGGNYLGIYETIEEAAIAHDKAKKEAITNIANEYKDKMPVKVYNALINWEPDYK